AGPRLELRLRVAVQLLDVAPRRRVHGHRAGDDHVPRERLAGRVGRRQPRLAAIDAQLSEHIEEAVDPELPATEVCDLSLTEGLPGRTFANQRAAPQGEVQLQHLRVV